MAFLFVLAASTEAAAILVAATAAATTPHRSKRGLQAPSLVTNFAIAASNIVPAYHTSH